MESLSASVEKNRWVFRDCLKESKVTVVRRTMSWFADWSKRRHVTLSIIEWSTRHGRPCVIIIMINGQEICSRRNRHTDILITILGTAATDKWKITQQFRLRTVNFICEKTSKRSLFSTAYSSTLRREFTAQRSRDIRAEVVCKSVVVVTACVVVATDGVVVCDVVAGKNRDS